MTDRMTIWLFYAFRFFKDFIFIYVVDKIFFLHRGIDLYQISLLIALWTLSRIVFEIPTGILADKWNRKYMLVLSGIVYFGCYFIWLFSFSFWGFLVGYLFRSLGSALASGTTQAYVYDFLDKEGKKDEFEKIWGRGRAFNTFGTAVAMVIGGIVAQFSLEWAVVLSLIPCLLLSAIALFFPEVPIRKLPERNSFKFLGQGLRYSLSHQLILQSFLFTAFVLASWGIADEYWSVYFQWLGLPIAAFGFVFASFYVMSTIGSMFAHHFKKYSFRGMSLVSLIMAILFIVVGFVHSFAVLILVALLAIVVEIVNVLIEGVIQHNSQSGNRATVASVNTVFSNFSVLTGVVFGWVAHQAGIQNGFLFLGILILAFVIVTSSWRYLNTAFVPNRTSS